MERVPREAFIDPSQAELAYEDAPLPIGEGQTISQPFIVALMVNALDIRRSDKVLEVGTGSGYQAAILSELASEVVTVERVKSLADAAKSRLERLGYANVKVYLAGERLGYPDEAPFNAIVVAAAAPKLPRGLVEQLAVGGRLIVPVGSRQQQELMLVTRTETGFSVRTLGECRFVPLLGEGAWSEEEEGQG